MSGVVWDQPTAESRAAREQLDAGVVALEVELRKALRSWRLHVDKRILGPLQETLAKADREHTRCHERLANALGRETPTPESYWDAVQAYVHEVHQGCIEDLVGYIDRSDPVKALDTLRTRTRTSLLKCSENLPDTVTVPREPGSGLDGLRRSLRMTGNTLLGMFGQSPRQLAHPTRQVEAREAARTRLEADACRVLDQEHQKLISALETAFLSLERSVWTWSVESLRFLSRNDKPWHHAPEGIRLKWPADQVAEKATVDAVLPVFAENSPFHVELDAEVQDLSADPAIAGLHTDLATVGTSSYRPPRPWPLRKSATDAGFSRDRLLLADALLDLGRDVREVRSGLIRQISAEALRPIERTYDSVKDHLTTIDTEAQAIIANHDPNDRAQAEMLADELQGLLNRSAGITNLYQGLPGLAAADRVLTEPGEHAWRSLMKKIAALPDSLRLRSVVGESNRAHRTSPMGVARAAFERSIPPRIESTAEPLRRSIARVWNDTEQVRDVVSNTFQSAIQHLQAEHDLDAAVDETGTGEAADVGDVVSSGLKRAADSLEDRYQSIAPEWAAFITQLHKILADDWGRAFRGVQSDDFLEKKLLGIQTAFVRRSERTWTQVTDWWSGTIERSRAAGRLLRRRAKDLIRIGQTAVGVGGPTTEERHRALDTVANARVLYAKLPLVYRTLFATDPVTDPGLAENREDDLDKVGEYIDRWCDGLGAGIVVVHGPLGSGRTSFLRLLDLRLRERLATVAVAFEDRQTNEERVADIFAQALFPDEPFEGDLGVLEALIKRRCEPRSTLMLVDNLELLLVQSPGGTELLNRVLLFWIRTDDRVAWCTASGSLAWQFASTAAGPASRLAITHALKPWTSGAVKDLIYRRHRRSGIASAFSPPEDPSPLTRQRLRRARTPQDTQLILESDFFDALFRASGQSPTRALFEWVRAGSFSEAGDQLTLRPFKTLSFAYLQGFENDIAFTLRAFLFHNILTVEDHARLFRTSEAGAIMAFETLLSEGLIEPLENVEGAAILRGVRYRLRRLVLQPVFRSLRERNFVY